MGAKDGADGSNGEQYTCPTCGDALPTEMGMNSHHVQKHGSSVLSETVACASCGEGLEITRGRLKRYENHFCSDSCAKDYQRKRETVTCKNCSEEFEVIESRVDNAVFCSMKCHGEWMSDNLNGENHPNYKGASEPCAYCGEEVNRPPADLNHRENTLCSDECLSKWISERNTGEKNHFYKDAKTSVKCQWCGSDFEAYKSHADRRIFCSRDCLGQHMSENVVGENHPKWRGGRLSYGPNWKEQRQRALRRDGFECADCGVSDRSHREEFGCSLSVHHITPVRKFTEDGELDYEQANRLENLISLCMTCHSKWEGIPVAPVRE